MSTLRLMLSGIACIFSLLIFAQNDRVTLYHARFENNTDGIWLFSTASSSLHFCASADTDLPLVPSFSPQEGQYAFLIRGDKDKAYQSFQSNMIDLSSYDQVSLELRIGGYGVGSEGLEATDKLQINIGKYEDGEPVVRDILTIAGYAGSLWSLQEGDTLRLDCNKLLKDPVTIKRGQTGKWYGPIIIENVPARAPFFFKLYTTINHENEYFVLDDWRITAQHDATWSVISAADLSLDNPIHTPFLALKGSWSNADLQQLKELLSQGQPLQQADLRLATFVDDAVLPQLFDQSRQLEVIYVDQLPALMSTPFEVGNTNCLVYAVDDFPFTAPNHIASFRVDELILNHGMPYHVPLQFKAQEAAYLRYFDTDKHSGFGQDVAGWESVVFPFIPQHVLALDKGNVELKPFPTEGKPDYELYRPFWLRELYNGRQFVNTDEYSYYKPYIICMPNNERYDESFNIYGQISFQAEQTTIFPCAYLTDLQSSPMKLQASFREIMKSDQLYVLDQPGAAFEAGLDNVNPFTAYLAFTDATASVPRRIPLEETGGVITDMLAIPDLVTSTLYLQTTPLGLLLRAQEDTPITVYSSNGCLLHAFHLGANQEQFCRLLPGVYIVNNQKICIIGS